MIAKAKAISHGANNIRYITGEASSKKHPEKIVRLQDRFMPEGLDFTGIWQSMQGTVLRYPRRIANSIIRIELSPDKKHTEHFTMQDWRDLWDEFLTEFDKQTIHDKDGKVISKPTHLAESKQTVWLHFDSASGTPHLHAAVCRVSEKGELNNDHHIELRAQRAAEVIARRHGWETAQDIHEKRMSAVADDCFNVLRGMERFYIEDYFSRLERLGYKVVTRKDNKGNFVGYALVLNKCRFKASELSRQLTVARIEATWLKLHSEKNDKANRPQRPSVPFAAKPTRINDKPVAHNRDYTKRMPDTVPYISADGKSKYYIPQSVSDLFNVEFDFTQIINWQELQDIAVKLFIGYLDAATSMQPSSGGGGGSSEAPWSGRKDDEDDIAFARRCVMQAHHRCAPIKRKGLHH